MNRKNRAKSSSLFLLELILAILFFSIASAVCVQIFVKSHVMSNDAQALNFAVSQCSGAAEVITCIKDEKEASALLQKAYPDGVFEKEGAEDIPGVFRVYYDEELQTCSEKSSYYQMTIRLNAEGTMLSASIQMNAQEDKGQQADKTEDDAIYGLDIVRHIQRRAGNE